MCKERSSTFLLCSVIEKLLGSLLHLRDRFGCGGVMKFSKQWYTLLLLAVLMLSLQGCLGVGEDSSSFQNRGTDKNGQQIQINTASQAKFTGKIYFTLDRNLYVLDDNLNLIQVTQGIDVRDPTVSPDGKWVAFVQRYKYYSDLVYMSTNP